MHDTMFAEMKSYVGYTDADGARLRAIRELIEPHLQPVIDLFYQEVQRHPGADAVLSGPEQVERLKKTLIVWLREVFTGPHDAEYALARRRIGHVHVKVGLPDRYMFTAMHVVERSITTVLTDKLDDPWPTLESLKKVLMMDLALMMGTYVEGREEKQLDTLQALLVEHLRVVVLLVGNDGTVRSATRATAHLMTGEDVVGLPWKEALPAGLVVAGDLERHVVRGLDRRREITLPRVDVEERSFRIHIVPLQHTLARFMLQVEELTDAVDMEARVRRSEALAQLGALSAAVAHELRNPLAGISGALQVITRAMEDGTPHKGILVKVDSEVRRLNGLVTDLLAFARPGSARLERVRLEALAVEVVDLLRDDHPGVKWLIRGEGRALGDPNLVRQILHNLLRNAVDAVDGAGQVHVEVAPGSLKVVDSGPGVPEEKRARIFEPFVTTKTRGTGLGLAICARSADAMSGGLRLVDSPLGGAGFELRLGIPSGDK